MTPTSALPAASRPADAPRLDWTAFAALVPATNAAMLALGQCAEAGLDPRLAALAKLRASQINGCAFCVQYHLAAARALGIAQDRLDLVAAWRHAGRFTAREGVALAWAEALTGRLDAGVDEALYAQAAALLPAAELAQLTVAIGLTNLWNRVGIAYRFPTAPG